ncbi:uncharacterized protein L969DRAFT_89471 [Mixia osmundae IAM 14324]|uniref:RRM domain-containing protein n=1 Tax=Mixia osmundae (strain CBS 9802 / IAM 14324 / JCM 22182 / KY 12970) TaxID=764103 RepID=G7DS71_MIXOS|nr:uncharacterized protein L969DRAFT_89471 [Mixia osmundae IAM 14324]KEI37516.1 hypothetical protein L969DRAFT_89471 [Mixia osmundae IAM 14324]GAA93431.1 hypothetical protein E5Q_00072 [Mixia osmundae IAM 14324]
MAAADSVGTTLPPNTTLYVQGLDASIKKEDLKRLLHSLFSVHGHLLDVVALKGPKMRGQAFVVYESLTSATTARRREDGAIFCGQPMRISYAKTKSHATIERESGKDVLYQIKMGIIKSQEEATANKRKGKLVVSDAQNREETTRKRQRDEEAGKKKRAGRAGVEGEEDEEEEDEDDDGDDETEPSAGLAKKPRTVADGGEEEMQEDSDKEEADVAAANGQPAQRPSSHILAVHGLPQETTEDSLRLLFQQYAGLTGARIVRGIGQIVYESPAHAAVALEALNQFQVSKGVHITVKYQ